MDELIPRDLCDTDLYKISMGQVVFNQFPRAIAKYRYSNRADDKSYPKGFAERFMDQVRGMADLRLTAQMEKFLKEKCPWLKDTYLQWLRGYSPDWQQTKAWQNDDGSLEIEVVGPWFETIYTEVPFLFIITQLSRTLPNGSLTPMSSFWRDLIEEKSQKLCSAGVNWIDFGTRRRAAYIVQDAVCEIMKHCSPNFRGTSNPYLAMKHNITPQGTCAHEMHMAMQAIYGMKMCNKMALEHWVHEYRGDLGIALIDTLTTPVFLRDFDTYYAKLFDGVRQDSGDPIAIGEMVVEHYKKLRIDPMSKILVFSDALTTDKAIEIHKHFLGKIKTTMGIGTHLTADVGWFPANHVIKLVEIDFGDGFVPLLKLSDSTGKNLGGNQLVDDAKRLLRIP